VLSLSLSFSIHHHNHHDPQSSTVAFFFFSYPKKIKMSSTITELEQEELLEKSEVFKIKGRDKHGRKILRIIGKFFPGKNHKPLCFS
jgi:hypothetical protein